MLTAFIFSIFRIKITELEGVISAVDSSLNWNWLDALASKTAIFNLKKAQQ